VTPDIHSGTKPKEDRPVERATCRLIEDESVKALQALLGDRLGVKVSFKGGQIGPGSCVLKFEFAEVNKDGSVETREATEYKLCAKLYGLPVDGLGRVFGFRGRNYKVVGLKPRGKYSILAERLPDGKRFKFEPHTAFPSLRKPLFGSVPVPPPPSADSDEASDIENADLAEAEGS
jgi:hypothetical protein